MKKYIYTVTDLQFIGLILFSGFAVLINLISYPSVVTYLIILLISFLFVMEKKEVKE